MDRIKGEIYLITNTLNNKVYVGKTYKGYLNRFQEHISKSMEIDKNGNYVSKNKFHQALRELGSQNFIPTALLKLRT